METQVRSLPERVAAAAVHVIGIILFFILSITSLLFTRYFSADYSSEIPYNKLDFFPAAVAGALVIFAFSFFAGRRITRNEDTAERNLKILLLAAVIWILAVGSVFVLTANSVPVSDQERVYTSAQRFLQGNFGRFEYGKYLYYYPSQLGLVAYESLILKIAGLENYTAIQFANVLWSALTVFSGYRITRLLTEKNTHEKRIAAVYLILMACCFPLIIYCAYVYGDIVYVSLSMAAFWQILRYLRHGASSGAVLAIICMGIAVPVRNNALIAAIAIFCILAVKAVSEKSLKHALVALLVTAVSFSTPEVVEACYENVSGIEIHDGMPTSLWIAMGMQDGDKEAGWYNGYSIYIYQDVYDYEGAPASAAGIQEIKSRVSYFLQNPLYAADFYFRKFTSQWDEPTYGCFVMTYAADEETGRGVFAESLYTGFPKKLLENFMDSYQLLIYTAVLAVLIYGFKHRKPLEWYLPLVCVIGGALFHTFVWEAKSRYVFPYFIMMIPAAAEGIVILSEPMYDKLIAAASKRKAART